MKSKVKITKATPDMVKKLLTAKSSPYDNAISNLSSGSGIIVNRREFMRTNNIGSVKEIPKYIKLKSSDLKIKLKSKNVGKEILIYKNK